MYEENVTEPNHVTKYAKTTPTHQSANFPIIQEQVEPTAQLFLMG